MSGKHASYGKQQKKKNPAFTKCTLKDKL